MKNLQGWPSPVCGVVPMRQHVLLLYARAYYTCTYPCTHTLHMRARVSAHECACTAHDAIERARTDTHAPWHVWADHARTHASALEHTCLHAHAHALCTHAGTFMHAPAQCTYMHTHVHARTHQHMRTHSYNHLHIWLRANRLGTYSSAVVCV